MRWLVLLLVACAARQPTAWTPVAPTDLDDGNEAFVLVGQFALHVKDAHVIDGHLRGHIVHAWEVPPVGVAALANDNHSPEAIARAAGWTELTLANNRLSVPVDDVRSARATIAVVDEDRSNADNDRGGGDHPFLEALLGSVANATVRSLLRR